MKIKQIIHKIFSGSERTKIVKKNIWGSFLIKGLSILTSLLLVPITIKLLDQEKYGIWMTIYSIVTWFNIMDMGLGNGFRNKFAEAFAHKNKKLSQEYIQTLYSSMALISIGIWGVFLLIHPFLNWYKILNIPASFNENINTILIVVVSLFCAQLFTKNISTIFLSLQKTAISNSLLFFANLISLSGIFILKSTGQESLLSIATVFMLSPLIVYSAATAIVFKGILKNFRLKISFHISKKIFGELMTLGIKFFIIQITGIIIFSSANIIITQLYGPSYVTPYNVANRLFLTTQSIFTIITTPFWTAFTEAHTLNDFNWIKKAIKKLVQIWGIFSIGIFMLWLISPVIFKIWVGKDVVIPFTLSLQFAINSIISTFQGPFIFYIYGVGKIKLIFFITIFQSIIYIPLAIIFSKTLNMNTTGVILATNICLLIPCIFAPIQYKKLIAGTAKKIWNK